MNFSDGPKRAVIILGAGATRGACFVPRFSPQPPLDKDFFQQLASADRSEDALHLRRFLKRTFGGEVGFSMETFFSEVHIRNRFARLFELTEDTSSAEYQKIEPIFLRTLGNLISRTTKGRCDHHELLASLLEPGDSILCFNYDCVMDSALRDNAFTKWDPDRQGYGFTIREGGMHWKDHSCGLNQTESIQLLKMHGSLNWKRAGPNSPTDLAEYVPVDDLADSVIPPTWLKELDREPFREIWRKARQAIREAEFCAVVGYSVPESDYFSTTLLRDVRAQRRLETIAVGNPDEAARRRFLKLMEGGLRDDGKFVEVVYLGDMCAYLRERTRYKYHSGRKKVMRDNILASIRTGGKVHYQSLANGITMDLTGKDKYWKYSEEEFRGELSRMKLEGLVRFWVVQTG